MKNQKNNSQKSESNNIILNKNKFGEGGYFNSITKIFKFEYSMVPEEKINCDIKINNILNCYFTTIHTFQKHEKTFLDEIKQKIKMNEENGSINFLFLYLDFKDDYLNNTIKKIIENISLIKGEKIVFDDNEKLKIIEKSLINLNIFCVLNKIRLICNVTLDEFNRSILTLTTLKKIVNNTKNNRKDELNNDFLIELLCKVDGFNKNDAIALLSYYKSIKNICISLKEVADNDFKYVMMKDFKGIDDNKKKMLYETFFSELKSKELI